MFDAIETERLVLRTPRMEDLDALHARRSDPEVARYQSWTLPYSRPEAEQVLTGAVEQDGPKEGEWWMITIVDRSSGEPVGDLALSPDEGGYTAEIGYSLNSQHWGKGYAGEAVRPLVRYLFVDLGVQRVWALIAAENVASTQVVERAGLIFEGQTKLSHWETESGNPAGSDAVYYGVTRADWDAWAARPTGRPNEVRLIEVSGDNQRAVEELTTHRSQERFVASALESFSDALFAPELNGRPNPPLLRAIEADGQLAGFIMLTLASRHSPEPYLWRLLVDRAHQRRGIGARAMDEVEEFLRSHGHRSLLLNWADGRGSPAPFYLGRGYEPTGKLVDGEVQARKQLT